ncbi:MAG: hypothetical protein MUC88_07815 [Planctomycetes bacterium]|jgi:hypothetical protein|nr:hypothetical protein [Planctomycetota bacterium]
MEEPRENDVDVKSVAHLLEYFDRQVLAGYQNESDKYAIKSDFFEGKLELTEGYFRELERLGRTDENLYIHFGYRTLKDGDLAIVAWLPDLFERSKTHIQRWMSFRLQSAEWTTDYDERFQKWVRRNLRGDWEVDNGPSYYLIETVNTINGLTCEIVNCPLYKHAIGESIPYPAAENTHRYQDSHRELYGYLIDGVNKDCIAKLATRLGVTIKIGDKITVKSLFQLLPDLESTGHFKSAMDTVSEQRRLASHGVRPASAKFGAFSQFTIDLYLCLDATKQLLAILEDKFEIAGRRAYERQRAKEWLPRITRPPQAHYSIVQALEMKGKTVGKVEVGFREGIEGVHESEAILVHFADGSIMSIVAGSNIGDLTAGRNDCRPEELDIYFIVNWVPPLRDDASEAQIHQV